MVIHGCSKTGRGYSHHQHIINLLENWNVGILDFRSKEKQVNSNPWLFRSST